jgi:hypothetical protein
MLRESVPAAPHYMWLAASGGHVDAVACLLQHPHVWKSHTRVALSVAFAAACAGGYVDVARALLPHVTPPDATANDSAALREACDNGHTHAVVWLLGLPYDMVTRACIDRLTRRGVQCLAAGHRTLRRRRHRRHSFPTMRR